MNLILPPETEARIEARAREAGISAGDYVARLVEESEQVRAIRSP